MITININKMLEAIAASNGKNLIHKCFTIIQNSQRTDFQPVNSSNGFKLMVGGVSVQNPGWMNQPVTHDFIIDVIGKLVLEIELNKLKELLQKGPGLGVLEQEKSFIDPYGYIHTLTTGESTSYSVTSDNEGIIYNIFGKDGLVDNMVIQAMEKRFQKHVIKTEVELDDEWCLNSDMTYIIMTSSSGIFLQPIMGAQQNTPGYNQLNTGFPVNNSVVLDPHHNQQQYQTY